jgi:hypothetical protein
MCVCACVLCLKNGAHAYLLITDNTKYIILILTHLFNKILFPVNIYIYI